MHETVREFGELTSFLSYVKTLSDETFFAPISPGKWSIAAIVTHIRFWDEFMLEQRLPYICEGAQLPKAQLDIQQVNKHAETYAHSGVSKMQLLEEACLYRQKVVAMLQKKDLRASFSIGDKKMTLEDYVRKEIEHDQHHIEQIKNHVEHVTMPYNI
ncbi:DinB family protein [Microbacteriaceae bacterium 4G12]